VSWHPLRMAASVPCPRQNGRNCGHERSPHGHRERPGRAPREASSALLPQDPSGVFGAYPEDFTEAGFSITAQYGSTGLRRVGGVTEIPVAVAGELARLQVENAAFFDAPPGPVHKDSPNDASGGA
jgi:hypothetical protein